MAEVNTMEQVQAQTGNNSGVTSIPNKRIVGGAQIPQNAPRQEINDPELEKVRQEIIADQGAASVQQAPKLGNLRQVPQVDRVTANTVREVQQSVEMMSGPDKKELEAEAVVDLPSRGLLYGGRIPPSIAIRSMTTKEEKILYAGSGQDVFKKVLRNCIVDPKNLDVDELISADISCIILQLRIITYGPEYNVSARCPECGHRDVYKIDLTKFDTDYLDHNFKEPIIVDLHRLKHRLELRLPRDKDSEFIRKFAQKQSQQFGIPAREFEYSARLASYIQKIDGNPIDFIDAYAFIDNGIPSADSAQIQTAIDDVKFGVNETASVVCSGCGVEFQFNVPLEREFFRPSIR